MSKKLYPIPVFIMLLLFGCYYEGSGDDLNINLDLSGPDDRIQILHTSVSPPKGAVLKAGDTVSITVTYAIDDYNDYLHADLCYKRIGDDVFFNETGENSLDSRDITAQTGQLTFSYTITESFINDYNADYPYIFYIQIWQNWLIPRWNNSPLYTFY